MSRLALLLFAACLALVSRAEQSSAPEAPPASLALCITCHGVEGRGNPRVNAPRIAGMEAWYVSRQLQAFLNGWRGTHDDDFVGWEMQAMVRSLTPADVSAAAAWFGGLDMPRPEATVQGDPVRGRSLYAPCAACHGPDARGDAELGAPALARQSDWYLVRQLENFRAGRRGYHADDAAGRQMAASVGGLGDERAIRDVVAYVASLD
ncbi:c-type cytochrome [Lentisalinibacter orientalis]|uniref:c-type cytochrome n=1 Tax=Lentisalinibacter orientalis TaxID=2992241 RepID=UPI0038647159